MKRKRNGIAKQQEKKDRRSSGSKKLSHGNDANYSNGTQMRKKAAEENRLKYAFGQSQSCIC